MDDRVNSWKTRVGTNQSSWMRWIVALLPAFALAAHAQTHGSASTDAELQPVIKHVAQVHELANGSAANGRQVHIVGTVTMISGYAGSFFIQDSTGGVDVEQNSIPVHVGDRIDLTGVTGPGHFAPIVIATRVKVIGTGRLPAPRRVVYADLMGGEQDSQRIEVEGVVRSVSSVILYGKPNLLLNLDMGGGTVRVFLQETSQAVASTLVSATVRVRGVCISDFNERRQFVGAGLIAPASGDLEIMQPAVADPFSIPLSPVRDVLKFGRTSHRVRISGIVTFVDQGHFLYLQDGGDAIRVQTSSKLSMTPGQRVEAVGFPVLGDYSPVLSEGYIRTLGKMQPVLPAIVDASRIISRSGEFTHVQFDQQLVQVEGRVLESRIHAGQRTWTMVHDDTVFEVSLPGSGGLRENLRNGSILQITGICVVEVDFDRNPTSFTILLRSPSDILVLKQSSWWTAGHLLVLTAALLSTIILIAIWVAMLRIRVRQQTCMILESEQRFRFLANHDGLTQLLNRNAILAELTTLVAAAQDRSIDFSVAIVDLDHFKHINDTYGHPAGDVVLRECAARLKGAVRGSDLIGRYGGEEFLIVLRGLKEATALDACGRILLAVSSSSITLADSAITVTCSIGVSNWSGRSVTAEQLIAEADSALYRAKRDGRNRVDCHADSSLHPTLELTA